MNELKPLSISIITPSLNQGDFIEETIGSILSQEYPELEYIIIDGGSVDSTLDVLRKYSNSLRWISEKDHGQTDAINRGMRMASGDIVAYLNADDILLPGSLAFVAALFSQHEIVQWLTGQCRIIDEDGRNIRSLVSAHKNLWLYSKSYRALLMTNYISQPATFWRRNLLEQCGWLDESLHYVMDYEYWLRIWKTSPSPPLIVHKDLAGFRIQRQSKTTSAGHLKSYIEEEERIIARYSSSRFWSFAHDAHRLLMTTSYSLITVDNQLTNFNDVICTDMPGDEDVWIF